MGALDKIGMIAGNGIYPATFARAAKAAGVSKLIATAFKGETEASLAEDVDVLEWMRVGQLSKMIRFFHNEGVGKAVMVGQIAPKNLFDLRPDLRTVKLLARLKEKNAESIFGAIADELANEGIELLPATTFLDDLLPEAGQVCGPELKEVLRQRDQSPPRRPLHPTDVLLFRTRKAIDAGCLLQVGHDLANQLELCRLSLAPHKNASEPSLPPSPSETINKRKPPSPVFVTFLTNFRAKSSFPYSFCSWVSASVSKYTSS